MKLFKIYASFFLIVGLFFGISLFFPRYFKFESHIEVNKPVHETFTFMNDLRNWEKWSAWNKSMDTTFTVFYGKRSDSLGGRQHFYGKLIGKGSFYINNYKPDEYFSYALYMLGGDATAGGTFYFTKQNNGTIISWVDSGDVGYNPIFRYMVPFKKKSTEAAFTDGLKRIKTALESRP